MGNAIIAAFFICQSPGEFRPLNQMAAVEALAEEGRFTNFVRALELSRVGDMLERKGPYTIFAPPDDVFNMGTIGMVTRSIELDDILYHHIVPGKYALDDIRRLPSLKTIGGYLLAVTARDGTEVNGAAIARPDLPYNKGIIHEIRRVL